MTRPATLTSAARAIVISSDINTKLALSRGTAFAWRRQILSVRDPISIRKCLPDRPGRPARPALLPPRKMPSRSLGTPEGRFALLHALAHIELNAIDLTWDLIARFSYEDLPRAFYDDWISVGLEESVHFGLLQQRLGELGGTYGDLPAHGELWQAAQATGHDLLARLAVVPLVLEARGLDVSPGLIRNLERSGDNVSANIIRTLYDDEKGHVAIGMRWFRFLCWRTGQPLEPTFHRLVRTYFRGALKPPFNDEARSAAGLSPGFYKPLTAFGAPA
ncbi:MAG: ferritin-like domain-containing protein [Hyphomicrobiaceae bacterium]